MKGGDNVIRGTTAQFKFNLPYKYNDLEIAEVTFWQPGNRGPDTTRSLPIVRVLEQCSPSTSNPYELRVTLTQEETLRFSEERKAYVQLRAKSKDGYVFASKQETLTIYPIYDESVLDNIIPPPPEGDEWIILDGENIQQG